MDTPEVPEGEGEAEKGDRPVRLTEVKSGTKYVFYPDGLWFKMQPGHLPTPEEWFQED